VVVPAAPVEQAVPAAVVVLVDLVRVATVRPAEAVHRVLVVLRVPVGPVEPAVELRVVREAVRGARVLRVTTALRRDAMIGPRRARTRRSGTPAGMTRATAVSGIRSVVSTPALVDATATVVRVAMTAR
jgi:hypothetical protein